LFEDLSGGTGAFREVWAGEVPPGLVGSDFAEEVGSGAEGFEIEEFVLNEAMGAFDIGVSIWSRRRQKAMGDALTFDEGVEAAFSEASFVAAEFGAVVGADDGGSEVNGEVAEMVNDAFNGQDGVGSGEFIGIVDEDGAGFDIAGGVLIARQA